MSHFSLPSFGLFCCGLTLVSVYIEILTYSSKNYLFIPASSLHYFMVKGKI